MKPGQVQNVIRDSLVVNGVLPPGLQIMLYDLRFTINESRFFHAKA